jgi:predicted lipoprotein
MRVPKMLAAAFFLMLPASAHAQPASPSAIVGNAIEDYITPGYAEFAPAAAALAD